MMLSSPDNRANSTHRSISASVTFVAADLSPVNCLKIFLRVWLSAAKPKAFLNSLLVIYLSNVGICFLISDFCFIIGYFPSKVHGRFRSTNMINIMDSLLGKAIFQDTAIQSMIKFFPVYSWQQMFRNCNGIVELRCLKSNIYLNQLIIQGLLANRQNRYSTSFLYFTVRGQLNALD